MKKVLGKDDTEVNLALEKKLRNLLDNSPIYLVLQWLISLRG